MDSLWLSTTEKMKHNSLNGNIKTDVLVIGGGMAGLLTAYCLTKSGLDCIVTEAKNISGGVTGNTTAKITSQHGFICDKIIKTYGVETAKNYFKANERAVYEYEKICGEINCEYEKKDNYVYSFDEEKISKEMSAIEKIGIPGEYVKNPGLPFYVEGAVKFSNQAQFHPLKFINCISEKLKVYENTFVRKLNGNTAICDNGTITSENIVIATHFPFIDFQGLYFMKMYQHRSYVLAFENADIINGMYVDENNKGMSFRNSGNLLLITGGGHRTGKQGGGWQELRTFAQKYFPKAKECYSWATQDCMTLDGMPYIGKYSEKTKNIFVATGFNKWGMTSSMVAADILTDMVLKKKNEFACIFDPSRKMMHPQLFINLIESAAGLITPLPKRCTHLGCALHYNKAEHSWDCSCHGSRFSEDGSIIDNPAKKGING